MNNFKKLYPIVFKIFQKQFNNKWYFNKFRNIIMSVRKIKYFQLSKN
jgi:hypothetical protein